MKKLLIFTLLLGLLALIPLGTASASEYTHCYMVGDTCLIISNVCFLDEVDCGDGSTWESQYAWKAGWCKAAIYAGVIIGTVDECMDSKARTVAERVEISSLEGMTPQRSQYQQSNPGGNHKQSNTGGKGQQSNSGGGNNQQTQTETTVTHTSLETLKSMYQARNPGPGQPPQGQQAQGQQQGPRRASSFTQRCVIGQTLDASHLGIFHVSGNTQRQVMTMTGVTGGCSSGGPPVCEWKYGY